MKNLTSIQEWIKQELAESRAQYNWFGRILFDIRMWWIHFKLVVFGSYFYQLGNYIKKLFK